MRNLMRAFSLMHDTLELKVVSQQQYSLSGDYRKRLRIHSAREFA
jgi:hypothetical protein